MSEQRSAAVASSVDSWSQDHEVLRVLSCADPFFRAMKFCQLYHPRPRDTDGVSEMPALSDRTLLRLVMQHLSYCGFLPTLAVLERESNVTFVDPGLNESRLLSILRSSIRAVDDIYNLVLTNTCRTAELDELLFRLGLLEVEASEGEAVSVNIWEEQGEPLYAADGSLRAATVNQLVLKATSESETDVLFLKQLLMTYRSFMTPQALLSKLIERFDIPASSGVHASEALKIKIKSRCVNVVKQWLTLYPEDFSDNMNEVLDEFVEKIGAGVLADSVKQPVQRMRRLKELRRTGSVGEEEMYGAKQLIMQSSPPPDPKVDLKTIFLPNFSLSMLDPEELARQTCLLFHSVFVKIRPAELLDCAWTKPNRLVRAPNVCRFIHIFNQYSYLVAYSILHPKTALLRAKQWKLWVNVLQFSWRLQNYSAVMAILGALNGAALFRLKETVRELRPATRQIQADMERFMRSSGSFKTYRDHFALVSSATPCVPYLGLLLTDLVFVESNPNNIEGMIAWSKRAKIFSAIEQVLAKQSPLYNLQEVPQVQQFILNHPTFNDDDLFFLSLQREPRGE